MTAAKNTNEPQPLGRQGNPELSLRDEPRADPRVVAALAAFGLDRLPPPSPVSAESSLEDKRAFVAEAEGGYEELFSALMDGLSPIDGVEHRTETITGVDGNEIALFIHRPIGVQGPVPGILHLHGGGMVMLSAAGPLYGRLRDQLAAAGMVIVGVEFRNAGGALGAHAFPAGLNDCVSALEWMHESRAELGVSKLVVAGESGGGNLTLATALKAKNDGKIDAIDGVYAMCPSIYGAWGTKEPTLPSLYENDGYFLDLAMMEVLAGVYDPGGSNHDNPLAWPYQASIDDLSELPPHVISVNELDPLRDEGLAYYRKLVRAKVSAVGRVVAGISHTADLMFPGKLPDVHAATLRDIHGFAASL